MFEWMKTHGGGSPTFYHAKAAASVLLFQTAIELAPDGGGYGLVFEELTLETITKAIGDVTGTPEEGLHTFWGPIRIRPGDMGQSHSQGWNMKYTVSRCMLYLPLLLVMSRIKEGVSESRLRLMPRRSGSVSFGTTKPTRRLLTAALRARLPRSTQRSGLTTAWSRTHTSVSMAHALPRTYGQQRSSSSLCWLWC